MLLAGDEFGHTQHGNNNPYCIEIPTDWARLGTPEGKALFETARRLIALRKSNPALTSDKFLHAQAKDAHGVPDISWWNASGKPMDDSDWNGGRTRALGIVFNNAATAAKQPDRLMVAFNSGPGPVRFTPPALPGGGKWEPVLGAKTPEELPARGFAVLRQKLD
jgi:glycogen operon protein